MGPIEAYKMAKQDMPKYMFRFTYVYTLLYFLSFMTVLIIGGIGCSILSESHPEIEMLPMAIAGSIAVILTVGLLVKAHLVYKRFRLETADALEKAFSELSFEDSEKQLKEEKVLDDTGFLYVVKNDTSATEDGKVLFENCKLYFCARYWVGKIYLSVIVLNYDAEEAIVSYNLLPPLFCYLRQKGFTFVNQPTFSLFESDKNRFVKLLLRCQNGDNPYINRIDKKARKYTN